MTTARPSSVLRPAASGLAGVALTVGLLSACSSGVTEASSLATTVPPTAHASDGGTITADPTAGTPSAAATTTAGVAETSSSAPASVPAPDSIATDTPQRESTDVVLSFVGWNAKTAAVEAGGYLSPVVESGGTCTLQLRKASRTVTAVGPAQPDASTTSCGNLAVPGTKLAPGTWTAVLRYSSATTEGKSDPTPVVVPR